MIIIITTFFYEKGANMKESRIKEMADYIGKYTNVSSSQLSKRFGISIYTVRRDIDELVKSGIATKRYGGVSINQNNSHLIEFNDRNTLNKEDKHRISKKAASLIKEGDIIFIDAGTTTMYIPDYIEDINITVVTNNIYVISKLSKKIYIKLIVLGGAVDKRTNSIFGIDTISFLKNINITKSFLACTGISNNFNITNYTVIEAELKKMCINISDESYLLADNSKFGVSSLVTYGYLDQLTAIITSKELPSHFNDYIVSKDIHCYCV